MKPTNLYLMTLFEISIFGHFGPQMQAGYLHSKIMDYFVKIAMKSPKITQSNNKWQFWNEKTLKFPKVPNFRKFEWLLSVFCQLVLNSVVIPLSSKIVNIWFHVISSILLINTKIVYYVVYSYIFFHTFKNEFYGKLAFLGKI